MKKLGLILVACVAAHTASAQAAKQCKVDTTAAWYAKQRAWFGDAQHTWSNDTLRAALVKVAGLSGEASQAVQFGWVITNQFNVYDTTLTGALRTLATTRGSVW